MYERKIPLLRSSTDKKRRKTATTLESPVRQHLNDQLLSTFGIDAVRVSAWFLSLPPAVKHCGNGWRRRFHSEEAYSNPQRFSYTFSDPFKRFRIRFHYDQYRGGWWCGVRFSVARLLCGGDINSHPTCFPGVGAALDVLDLLVSDAIGQRSWVQSWSVRTVEVFSDVDTDWCRLKTAVMKLSGKRGFRFKERHNGSCLVLRSDKNKCPWALVFYDKQAEEEHKTGTATKWSQGRVRVEVRAWSKPAVDRLADGNGTTLADVLLRGDFVGFFRWAFDRVHLHEGLTVDPKGTLQNAGFRGATLKRISSLLAAVDERGWSSVLDNPPEGYADEKGNRRLRADVLRLEKLGVVLPDREENALLGDVCRSVAGSVRDHQRERTRWPGIYEYFGFEPPVAVVLEEPLSSDVIAEVVAEGSSAAHRPPFVFVRVRPVPLFRPRKGVVVPMRFMDGVGIHARGP